jgi:hypothetical protein
MRRIVSLVSWWALLVLLWLAYVGTTQTLEVLWGIAAAAIAAVAVEVARSQLLLHFTFERRLFFRGLTAPEAIVFDFGVVTWELLRAVAHGRRVEGRYLEAEFPAGEEGRARVARVAARVRERVARGGGGAARRRRSLRLSGPPGEAARRPGCARARDDAPDPRARPSRRRLSRFPPRRSRRRRS